MRVTRERAMELLEKLTEPKSLINAVGHNMILDNNVGEGDGELPFKD